MADFAINTLINNDSVWSPRRASLDVYYKVDTDPGLERANGGLRTGLLCFAQIKDKEGNSLGEGNYFGSESDQGNVYLNLETYELQYVNGQGIGRNHLVCSIDRAFS